MLVCNGTNNSTARCRFTGAGSFAGFRTAFGAFAQQDSALDRLGFARSSSVPHGYRGGVAWAMAITDGGMSAYLSGVGAINADLNATGNLTSSLAGAGSIAFANLAGGINMSAALAGVGSIANAPLPAFGNLTCSISIGARPSATDIAQAVWEELLSGHNTAGTAAKKLKDGLTRNDFIGLQ